MLAALVVASFWAQAEPAPPETPTAAPRTTLGPAPAPAPPPPPEPDNALAVTAGAGYRLGPEGARVGPRFGPSVGGSYRRRYWAFPNGAELGAGLDFFYDQFQTDVTGSAMTAPGEETPFAGQRTISETSFAIFQSADWRLGRVRPFAQVGLGLTIAYFSSPELAFRPGSLDAVQPLARAAGGVEVIVYRGVAVSLRAGYSHLFTRPTLTATGANPSAPLSYSFFGDLLDAGLGVVLPF